MDKASIKNFDYDLDSSMFTVSLIFGIAFFTLLSEIGFSPSYLTVFTICGIAFLFVTIPLTLKLIFSLQDRVGFDAMTIILLLVFTLITSFLPNIVSTVIGFVFSILGYGSLLIQIIKLRKLFHISKLFIWVICPFFLVIWIIGFIHSGGIQHPLFFEKLSMGIINRDQLFHSSIAEMIKTYGVPSTGLHGIPYLPYHFGSHLVLACFSNFLGISALKAYNFLYPILFIPLYFKVLLSFIKDFARTVYKNSSPLSSDWLFWLLFITIVINFFPNDVLSKNWAIWESWIVSESYLISLFFLFSSGAMILSLLKEENKWIQFVLVILVFFSLAFSGLSKISVIFTTVGSLLYIILRMGIWRTTWVAISGIVFLLILILELRILGSRSISQLESNFYPLHFIKVWTDESWRPLFVIMFYFFLITYILIRLHSERINDLVGLRASFLKRELPDVEFLLIVALIGFAPVLLFLIKGGSAYYLVDVQTRVSIAFILAWVLNARSKEIETHLGQRSIGLFLRKYLLFTVIAILFSLNNVLSRFDDFLNTNLQLRLSIIKFDRSQSKFWNDYRDIYHYFSGNSQEIIAKFDEITYLPAKILYQDAKYKYYKWLRDTCSQIDRKDRYLIKIARTSPIWTEGHVRQEMAPFIIPALTGIALADGLPNNFKDIGEYGFPLYADLKLDTISCVNQLNKEILIFNPYTLSVANCEP